jgi:hypothetical protein
MALTAVPSPQVTGELVQEVTSGKPLSFGLAVRSSQGESISPVEFVCLRAYPRSSRYSAAGLSVLVNEEARARFRILESLRWSYLAPSVIGDRLAD